MQNLQNKIWLTRGWQFVEEMLGSGHWQAGGLWGRVLMMHVNLPHCWPVICSNDYSGRDYSGRDSIRSQKRARKRDRQPFAAFSCYLDKPAGCAAHINVFLSTCHVFAMWAAKSTWEQVDPSYPLPLSHSPFFGRWCVFGLSFLFGTFTFPCKYLQMTKECCLDALREVLEKRERGKVQASRPLWQHSPCVTSTRWTVGYTARVQHWGLNGGYFTSTWYQTATVKCAPCVNGHCVFEGHAISGGHFTWTVHNE